MRRIPKAVPQRKLRLGLHSLTKRMPRKGYASPLGIVTQSAQLRLRPASAPRRKSCRSEERRHRPPPRSNRDGARQWPWPDRPVRHRHPKAFTGLEKWLTKGPSFHAVAAPQRLKPTLKHGVCRSGKPLRHPKARTKSSVSVIVKPAAKSQRLRPKSGFSYHSSNTNSAQNPGPIAASNPSVPGAGRRFFMTSSSTTSTEADDRLPVRRRHCHEASSSPFFNPRASAVASRILRRRYAAPNCRCLRVNPRSARKSSRSWARFFRTRFGISRERTMRNPFRRRPSPSFLRCSDRRRSESREWWRREARFVSARYDHRGRAVAEQSGKSGWPSRLHPHVAGERAEFDGEYDRDLFRIRTDIVGGTRNGRRARHATQPKDRDTAIFRHNPIWLIRSASIDGLLIPVTEAKRTRLDCGHANLRPPARRLPLFRRTPWRCESSDDWLRPRFSFSNILLSAARGNLPSTLT